MKILYIGSSGVMSYLPLKALLDKGFEIDAIAVDDTVDHANSINCIPLTDVSARTIQALAYTYNIAIIKLADDLSDSVNQIQLFRPDLILVSCYARILPVSIISIPKRGCYNIHPSLLPAYPGPDPVFWQLNAGESTMGVSIHRVTDVIDGGAILIQAAVTLKTGLSKLEIDTVLAATSADLLITALQDFKEYQNAERKQRKLPAHSAAAYRSFAELSDVNLSSNWPARRLYNFICAYAAADTYFNCSVNQQLFQLVRAIDFNAQKKLDVAYRIEGNIITFACSPGLIQCQLCEYDL